ncbi:MAG TPA: hypothetical protein VGM78_13155, partial [Ilumatobacteraceae bacterium]
MTVRPEQPAGVPWPTIEWPRGELGPDADAAAADDALRQVRELPAGCGVSLATVVVHHGRIVAEQYGPDTDASTTLISWSMAKSITQALFGLL